MRVPEINRSKLTQLFTKELELCRVKRGETVCVLTDINSPRDYVAAAFLAAEALGAASYEICTSSMAMGTDLGEAGVGEAKGMIAALKSVDLIVSMHMPLFTRWGKEVRKGGTRILIAQDAPAMLDRLLTPPGLKDACLHAAGKLRAARTMRVTSAAGTDLTVELGEYPTFAHYGAADEPGKLDIWGQGHVYTFPNEGTANGTVVIQPGDIFILPYIRYAAETVRLEIRQGFVARVDGGLDAKLMNAWLEDNRKTPDDTDGHAISHLGWGLHPRASSENIAVFGEDPAYHGSALRSVPGNFLFSTGPNTEGGGSRMTKAHFDIPMRGCTVTLDNETVIEAGRLTDPKMIVAKRAA